MTEPGLFGVLPMQYILTISGLVLGGVFGLLKWFMHRMVTEIDARLKRIDEIEGRFERLLSDLPMHYQRREDSIREYTALNAKVDRIYELMLRTDRDRGMT